MRATGREAVRSIAMGWDNRAGRSWGAGGFDALFCPSLSFFSQLTSHCERRDLVDNTGPAAFIEDDDREK